MVAMFAFEPPMKKHGFDVALPSKNPKLGGSY
jgi:hypothetical protein